MKKKTFTIRINTLISTEGISNVSIEAYDEEGAVRLFLDDPFAYAWDEIEGQQHSTVEDYEIDEVN
tara:strand:- start:373 stop:570 length:198 start_codon:yes stop_codon:yes gene_type:complete